MIIVGEKINSTRKPIAEAIAARDKEHIQKEAQAQSEAGADYIDVNAAAFMEKEAECLQWVIEAVQEATETPLCLDSPDPAVIKKVIPLAKIPPMINSINLEPSRLEALLPLIRDYSATVIGLCQTKEQMGKTVQEKVAIAGRLVEKITAAGIGINSLYIDPLVFPVGTDTKSVSATLDAIEIIMKQFNGVHTICGLTNVSHGLPQRKLINRTLLAEAIARGLDAAILDPTDRQLVSVMRAALMLMGKDEFCMEYIKAFRKGQLE
ncbi:MAG: methyltetrahydrofolate--corrinoid methyltransferase [Deltaproteobacteria bacterium HGW-Deltaproteobacteria-12]|jgi:5-methyltetrahydrofolate--homocysteine methyltransferase|nr:MAG: methyltetrahydrofolate--corrinoid methyltransferase [Deltaproteobacteria bacterium HGW-Deltaproteobacteria-12]